MRIAIFTNNYLPNPYGVSGSIESFRKELERMGHTVYVFAPNFKGYVDENENACPSERRVFRYPAIDFKFKDIRFPIAIPYSCLGGRQAYRISRLLKKLELDIIHCQHPNLLGWAGAKWSKKKKVPLIFTWHTLYNHYAHFAPLLPEKFAANWAIKNARNFANAANCIIVPTPSVKEMILRWGVSNKNIVSIPSGVNGSEFENADKESVRKELEIAEDEVALLLVSRITDEKNVIFLANVIARVLSEDKESNLNKIKFILAGDGNKLSEIKKIFSHAGVDEKVSYLGLIAGERRKNVYAAGDIFVYASKSETQGMIISEAMYMGLPVVALSATGVNDMITNQVTGLLVKENEQEFAMAIRRLVNDEKLRKKFSENAGKISRQWYTSAVCTQRLISLYEKTILESKERKN